MSYIHVIFDAETGERTEVPFTEEEIAQRLKEEAEIAAQIELQSNPLEKLKLFISSNPDVASLLGK